MDYEVAIVGGGPSGIATALFLSNEMKARTNRIVVLEKSTYPREKICAGAIGRRAERLLAAIGVHITAPSVPIFGLSVSTTTGEILCCGSEQIGRVVRRIEFDASLANSAREQGIQILDGTKVVSLSRKNNMFLLETNRGVVTSKTIVGADGVGSFVRRALNFPKGQWMAQVVEVDTPRSVTDRRPDILHFDLTNPHSGYAWDFATPLHGSIMMSRGVYQLQHESHPYPSPDTLLDQHLTATDISEPFPRKRFAERGLSLHEPMSAPGVLLVGEAAGIDPVLGEGIAQSIYYGKIASKYIAQSLETKDLSFATWKRFLRKSRLGTDLWTRTRMAPWFYGAARDVAARWAQSSFDLVDVGMQYFGGQHVNRRSLWNAGNDFMWTFVENAKRFE